MKLMFSHRLIPHVYIYSYCDLCAGDLLLRVQIPFCTFPAHMLVLLRLL